MLARDRENPGLPAAGRPSLPPRTREPQAQFIAFHLRALQLTQELIALPYRLVPLAQELVLLAQGDVALAQVLVLLAQGDVALAQVLVALAQRDVPLPEVDVPLVEVLVSLGLESVALRLKFGASVPKEQRTPQSFYQQSCRLQHRARLSG